MPFSSDLRALETNIVLCDGVSVSPKSTQINDFSKPVIYQVSTFGIALRDYEVSVFI